MSRSQAAPEFDHGDRATELGAKKKPPGKLLGGAEFKILGGEGKRLSWSASAGSTWIRPGWSRLMDRVGGRGQTSQIIHGSEEAVGRGAEASHRS